MTYCLFRTTKHIKQTDFYIFPKTNIHFPISVTNFLFLYVQVPFTTNHKLFAIRHKLRTDSKPTSPTSQQAHRLLLW